MTLKEKMLSGQKIVGTMLRIVRNPAVCVLARDAGLDFVMFDCEHSNYSTETLHDCFLMAGAVGLGGFFRAASLSKESISRVMDAGGTGVMVPMTETPAQAEELVKWSKYPTVGERGFCAAGASVSYRTGVPHVRAMEEANAENIAIAQIETRLAVDNAEAIAATPGIDALLIGPNDLSISLGIPGDLMNPVELEAITHVAGVCKKQGKAFGIHGGVDMLRHFIDDMTLVMLGTDTDALRSGFRDIGDTCRGLQ